MLRKKRGQPEQTDLRLQSQLGEEECFRDLMRRMARENKIAVASFVLIAIMILAAALAPLLTPYDENEMDLAHRLAGPSAEHLLGTDEGGRDVLTRLLFGARISILIGVVPALLSLILGAMLGVAAGYKGRYGHYAYCRRDAGIPVHAAGNGHHVYARRGDVQRLSDADTGQLGQCSQSGTRPDAAAEKQRIRGSCAGYRRIRMENHAAAYPPELPADAAGTFHTEHSDIHPDRKQPELSWSGCPASERVLGADDQYREAIPVHRAVDVLRAGRGNHDDSDGLQLPGERIAGRARSPPEKTVI